MCIIPLVVEMFLLIAAVILLSTTAFVSTFSLDSLSEANQDTIFGVAVGFFSVAILTAVIVLIVNVERIVKLGRGEDEVSARLDRMNSLSNRIM